MLGYKGLLHVITHVGELNCLRLQLTLKNHFFPCTKLKYNLFQETVKYTANEIVNQKIEVWWSDLKLSNNLDRHVRNMPWIDVTTP